MSGILPVDANGVSAPSTAASKAKVDYDAFLQLLVAEMKNQDPTEPMDSAQFISQLASFSNVEQGIQTNEKLAQLLTANALTAATQVVGHTISQADGAPGRVVRVEMGNAEAQAILHDGRSVSLSSGWTLHEQAS